MSKKPHKESAERLRAARAQRFKTASLAARALGLQPVTVRAHESGQNGLKPDILRRYADAYGVSSLWILYGDGIDLNPRPSQAAISVRSLGNGTAHLEISKTVPMAVALRVLALMEGAPAESVPLVEGLPTPARRLESARTSAGFKTATEAAEHHGWKPSTYMGHENGSRGLNAATAEMYGAAFSVAPEWLLFGRSAAA